MVNLSKTLMEGHQVLSRKIVGHHSRKKLLIGSLPYTRLVSTVALFSASPISWASQSLASGGRQETEQYPAKPAYSIMICNSACVWDKEVASQHLGCPNVPSNRPGLIRPTTGVYDLHLSNFFHYSIVGLDVNRTDRLLVYYERQENLARLWDILAVYSWIDKDIGYCQGELLKLCFSVSAV
jgi:hypothetical protein